MTRRLTLVAAVALLALAGCAKKSPTAAATADTVLTPTATATAAPTATAKATNTPTPPKSSPSMTTAPTGPTILYFRVKTKPNCESVGGGGQVFPARDAVLEWAVANVTNVTISIDGPGIYNSYDATSTQTLPFTCGGQTNTKYTHTYTLRTVGGGPEQKQTLTVEAHKS